MTARLARHKRRNRKELRIEYKRPALYPKQEQFLFCGARYSVVEASTKTGKTVGCLAWLVEKAVLEGFDGWNGWWIAPVYRQAEIAYTRAKRAIDPAWYKANDSKLCLTLVNGAQIWFKGSERPDLLYGEDVFAAVIDEATRVKEAAWHAVRSTLTATKGQCRIIGNVVGSKNWAYKLARMAELEHATNPTSTRFYYAKLTVFDAFEAGIVDLDEIEDARRTLPKHVFEELYLAIPTPDGSNPFGMQAIAAVSRLGALSQKPPVVWGVDLAKSFDWTVCIGLDEDGHLCRFERFQLPWRETLKRVRALVGTTPAYVDSTGVGDPIVEFLMNPELPSAALWRVQAAANTAQAEKDLSELLATPCPNVVGVKFTSTSKQQLIENLAVVIQERAIALLADPHHPLRLELESFGLEVTRTGIRYQAPEGMTDDCVIALALACQGRRHALAHALAPAETIDL